MLRTLRPLLALTACFAPLAGAQTSIDTISGTQTGGNFGSALAAIDLEGDGRGELLIGEPNHSGPAGADAGALRLWDQVGQKYLATFHGEASGDQLGFSVAVVEDLDNDGVREVVVGAPEALDPSDGDRSGAVYLLSGKKLQLMLRVYGEEDGDRFGHAVAGGVFHSSSTDSQLVVGAPHYGAGDSGRVYLIDTVTGKVSANVDGASGSELGTSVAHCGDVNQDGRPEFIAGAPKSGGGGEAKVYRGHDLGVVYTWQGSVLSRFGHTVGGGTDLDLDGVPDIWIASPWRSGSGFTQQGRVDVIGGATGIGFAQFHGVQGLTFLGMSMCAVGDVDRDGGPDLLVGGERDEVYVFNPLRQERILVAGGSVSAGLAVADMGDVDQDGVPDMAMGAPSGGGAGEVEILASAPWVIRYCVGGLSATPCRANMTATGSPSASASAGFTFWATLVEGDKAGMFYFGQSGRQTTPWGNGTSMQCVTPPVRRGGLLPKNGTAGVCDGFAMQDMNALWCSSCPKPNFNFGAGTVVQAQFWYRDPLNSSGTTTSLSNAIEFVMMP